ncbi:putative sulfate exporter family transporter [Caulobacter segnis]
MLGGLAIGAAAGVALGPPFAEALIAAAACSICGASAALAASQAAPASPANQRTTALVIVGVNLPRPWPCWPIRPWLTPWA